MEEPLRPGPQDHVGYVADIRRIDGNAHLTVMAIYTTTTPWEQGVKLPLGIIPVEPAMAQSMNQKGFVMDARKIAFMPVNRDFFPRLAEPDKGIIYTAAERWHRLVQNTLMTLAKRPDLIVKSGPDMPGLRRPK